MKVYIWGVGVNGKNLIKEALSECDVLGFIDSYKFGRTIAAGERKYTVIHPSQIADQYDYIIISNSEPREVIEQCRNLGIPEDKLIAVHNYVDIEPYIMQDEERIKNEIPSLYRVIDRKNNRKFRLLDRYEMYKCYYDAIDEKMVLGIQGYTGEYLKEYIRYRAFELAVNELKNRKGEWAVAELGVFKGAFSSLINYKFPNRKLYMFDTFEGFDANEANKELREGNCNQDFIEYFANNHMETVVNRMPYKEMCVVRKGLFPSTAMGLDDVKYGFVSLDVDFGDSTLHGLEYFYPRLIQGGYIFIHDYNHPALFGVKEAVKKYEETNDIILCKVPLPDSNGTLVIIGTHQ